MREIIIPGKGIFTEVKIEAKKHRPIYLLFEGKIDKERLCFFENREIQEIVYDNFVKTKESPPFLALIVAGKMTSLASDFYDKDEYKSKALLLTADQIAKSFCSHRDEPFQIR
jgi:hypothetical protein